ncbi:TetR family transcriptional regulator [Herbihabitans rhizosphaerae]|uniref:TetR family transcriptional regulator n=1 Tax=Herbihabitans rhizosphaerae TaxID=1872711 RepID=A0A4Q7KCZ1_9PSEU|nr:TetR/AcrR family transcriptional regulator [Herbihabitans rhizosphaerae]RZS31399.1 TetR family transcriptional regulator [Herbihabitans rhizosphaerae]
MPAKEPPPRSPRRAPTGGERRRDPERTKARIIDAAKIEFSAKGYAATRVADIADRAGVNKQLISYYFGGKEGLHAELNNQWRETGSAIADLERPLDAVVADFVMSTLHEREAARMLVWSNMSTDEGAFRKDPAQVAFLRGQVDNLRRRQESGELPADLDPAHLMLALFAAASAVVALPRIAEIVCDEDPSLPEFTEKYADQIARLVKHLSGS